MPPAANDNSVISHMPSAMDAQRETNAIIPQYILSSAVYFDEQRRVISTLIFIRHLSMLIVYGRIIFPQTQ
jgi:hypothetical protein